MLKIEYQGQFKKDYKAAIKRGLNPSLLVDVVTLLAKQEPLPERYRDHKLTNSRRGADMRECHIQPDWLLIYQVLDDTLILRLIRTGSHGDWF